MCSVFIKINNARLQNEIDQLATVAVCRIGTGRLLIIPNWASLRASLNPKMHEDMDLITKELKKVEILCQIFYQRSYKEYIFDRKSGIIPYKILDRKSGIVDLFQLFFLNSSVIRSMSSCI